MFIEWANKLLEHKVEGDDLENLLQSINYSTTATMSGTNSNFKNKSKAKYLSEIFIEDMLKRTNEPPSAEVMAAWFLENYKDPADGVPYNSHEGGYQYWNGCPYDAESVIFEMFPDATVPELREASEIVEHEGGPEWVKVEQY